MPPSTAQLRTTALASTVRYRGPACQHRKPGLEINFLFRKVRDLVREKTAKKQEPFLYGSLGSEQLYFKAANAR
jgi:hypothetical protein